MKETKVYLKSIPRNDKTQDEIQQPHMEEGKVDFKFDSEIKSETEKERKMSPEKSQTFSSRIKKVIEIKDLSLLSERITKIIHLKEYIREKRVINSENSKEEALRKSYPL